MITSLKRNKNYNYSYYLVDTIPSTNTYLKNNYSLYPNNTVLVALEQTAGRGRYDRVWKSDNDIIFSILLKENSNYAIITPLAIVLALDKLGYKTGIKWPNDIYMDNQKLAGILIEDIFSDKFLASIIGIGINLSNKASVHGIGLNTDIDKFDIIDMIVSEFDSLLKKSSEEVMKLYIEKSVVIGKEVYYKDNIFTVHGINMDGHLILKSNDNTIIVSSDEINIKESLV